MNVTKKIPYLNLPDEPIISTTQKQVPVADIVRDMILYKDGGAALVLESTSLNFGLLSEREQEAVVAAYAALINSLSFPLQILVRTQKKDVSNYISYLDEAAQEIHNQKLKSLMLSYRTFIAETIKKKNVLEKRFFLVIPFSQYELGVTKSFQGMRTKSGPLPFSKDYVLKKAEISLYPKRDHLIRQASRLGLKLRQLTNAEIIKLLYDVFNPRIESLKAKDEEKME